MNINELNEYLKQNIPLSQSAGIEVIDASFSHVSLSAPLGPNINHADNVFGGSVSVAAILSAFLLLYIRTAQEGINAHLVIHKNTIEYKKPIADTFVATSRYDDAVAWKKFKKMLEKKGLARIILPSVIRAHGEDCAEFQGVFVGKQKG